MSIFKSYDGYFDCKTLASMRLEGFPATTEGVRGRVETQKWPWRTVPSPGVHGQKKVYLPPDDVRVMISKLEQEQVSKDAHNRHAEPFSCHEERANYRVNTGTYNASIDSKAVGRVALACAEAYGDAFRGATIDRQIEVAAAAYQAMRAMEMGLRLPEASITGLDAGSMVELVKVLTSAGAISLN